MSSCATSGYVSVSGDFTRGYRARLHGSGAGAVSSPGSGPVVTGFTKHPLADGRSIAAGFNTHFFQGQQAAPHGHRDRCLPRIHTQFPTGVVDVIVDGALGKPENATSLPTRLAHRYPFQTKQLL